jgi:hypothetical protein
LAGLPPCGGPRAMFRLYWLSVCERSEPDAGLCGVVMGERLAGLPPCGGPRAMFRPYWLSVCERSEPDAGLCGVVIGEGWPVCPAAGGHVPCSVVFGLRRWLGWRGARGAKRSGKPIVPQAVLRVRC